MDNNLKNTVLIAGALDDLLVKGITDVAAERTLQRCKEALENTKDIAVCSIRARKPAIRITLDKYFGDDEEEIASFRKKAESAKTFTAFTDYLKRLESIEKACREKLYAKCIMSKGDSHIISKDDFESFFKEEFEGYKEKWDETQEAIRLVFPAEIIAFRNKVEQIINNTPYAPETADRLKRMLKRVCSIQEDEYIKKLTLELDSAFSPDAFEDEEMIAAVTRSSLNRTRRDMAEIIGGLVQAAYEGTCKYLLQVGMTDKDTTWGLVSSKKKFVKVKENILIGNIFEFEPIIRIGESMEEIANIEDTLDARYALLELLSGIWALGNKYDLELDAKKLPNAESIRVTPELLEEGV